MLRSGRALEGLTIHGSDGAVGTVDEFYFDDSTWVIRYWVVDTGTWLSGRRVLVSPFSLGEVQWSARTLQLSITREQVRSSPPVESHRPVSRQKELEYLQYYAYPAYWGGPGLWGAADFPLASLQVANAVQQDQERDSAGARPQESEDSHLRSSREVTGYRIGATDGELGHVEDFLLDDGTWAIRYVVVDTSSWWGGRRVLIAPAWIRSVSWPEAEVFVELDREAIKTAPPYDRHAPITREYEERIHEHYGRPGYWNPQGRSPSS